VFGKDVILEIKFTGCFPNWFGEMARTLGLQQRSAAKYADGVALLGEHRLRPGQARGFAADLPPARASQCLAAEGIA
jgi:hypothetical protein